MSEPPHEHPEYPPSAEIAAPGGWARIPVQKAAASALGISGSAR